MVKERDISNIFIKNTSYFPLKKNKKIKEVIGFDTETEKGKCFLISYYEKEVNKKIKYIRNFDDIIKFMFSHQFRNTINFFYNLNYDFQAIIKHIPMNNLRELAKYDKTIYKKILISYLPNKAFTLSYNKHNVKFFDIAQFYNYLSLNKAGKKYIGLKKDNLEENLIDIKNLSAERYLEDLQYKYYIDKYLFLDVKITKLLGQKLYEMMKPYIIPKAFYSQATFSQQYFLENLKRKVSLPSKSILQYALSSYQGGRFEVFKRGYFEKSYIMDIKSAYPHKIIKIPNLTTGEWKKSKEYEPESLISIYKINTNIYDMKISPLKYQLENNLMIYPIGEYKNIYINKQEIELLQELGFNYKIDSAYHYFDKDPEFPYLFLEDFYDLKEKYKQEGKNELSWIPKIMMNGFYGKMIQLNPKLVFTKEYKGNKNLYDVVSPKGELIYIYRKYEGGKLFNPIVANEITANTRVQLFKAVQKDTEKIIGFQTDSIISEKKLNLDYSDKLGSWELERKGELVILGSGIYQVLGNRPMKKLRGFSKNMDLYKILNDNLDSKSIEINLTRNFKLKKTMKMQNYNDKIINDKEKMRLFNLIKGEIKSININFDKKRIWDRNFEDCYDVLNNNIDSKPIII